MKGLVDTFNQEKALVGAFSVIVKTDGSFAALVWAVAGVVVVLGAVTLPSLHCRIHGAFELLTAGAANAEEAGEAQTAEYHNYKLFHFIHFIHVLIQQAAFLKTLQELCTALHVLGISVSVISKGRQHLLSILYVTSLILIFLISYLY